MLQQLPSLQHLELSCVHLVSTSSLLQLTHEPQLTSLTVERIDVAGSHFSSGTSAYQNTAAAVRQVAAAVSCMLQMLPRLSVRELPGMPLSDAAVQQLAAMQGLRQVSLSQLEHMPACDVQRLPNSITQLHFSSFRGNGPSLPSQLQQLTRPLQLHLQDCAFLPTMLGSVTQLQTLCVDTCRLLPGGSQGTAALLDVLPKLSCLQDLELRCLDRNMTALYDVSQEAFSALTASSHLTRLVVDAQETPPLPYLALAYMFKDQQRTHLAKLEELQISTVQQQPSPSAEPVPVLLACMHVCLCLLLLAGCCQGVSGASRQLLQCSCVLSVK